MASWNSENLNFRESGSIRFSQEQLRSYALILDVEIVSYIKESYVNFKGNPPYGYWGTATVFQGGVPIERKTLEWTRQRIINVRNEAAATAFNDEVSYFKDNAFQLDAASALDFVITSTFTYPAAPILEHKETLVKFRALDKSQFKFTVWWMPFPTSSEQFLDFSDSDPTAGFDEYPEPTANPSDNPYIGNADPDEPNPASDPRDFSDENQPASNVLGYGTGSYEFRDAGTNGWSATTKGNLGYPGNMIPTTSSGGFNEVSWQDADGVTTSLVFGASPPVQVRNLTIAQPNGGTYTPFNDSFSN